MKRAALFLLILFASCEKIIYKGVDNCHVTSLTGKNNQFNFIYVNNLLVQFEEDSATFYRIDRFNNLLRFIHFVKINNAEVFEQITYARKEDTIIKQRIFLLGKLDTQTTIILIKDNQMLKSFVENKPYVRDSFIYQNKRLIKVISLSESNNIYRTIQYKYYDSTAININVLNVYKQLNEFFNLGIEFKLLANIESEQNNSPRWEKSYKYQYDTLGRIVSHIEIQNNRSDTFKYRYECDL